jgi:hypothetical protein
MQNKYFNDEPIILVFLHFLILLSRLDSFSGIFLHYMA